jgi:proteasome lid subunit RPN8/RPN11
MGAGPVSGDEIVFGEIRYREPVRLLRPDRDMRYAYLSYQMPAQTDLPIFIDYRAAEAIERHALRDTSVELGGILLGKECLDDTTGTPFVWITQSLEAKHYANTQASFTYTHDSWEEITRERDELFPDLDIVGWYHTHPSFGIFLSHHDIFIHQHFFAQTLQVAYVVDPVQQTRGFFQWRDRNLAQVEGYYLTADRGGRIALAKLANDLENLPSPSGQGGTVLSPRLEAELLTMLNRSSSPQYVSSPSDRLQTAMLFGMLGSFLGVLVVAAAFWLYQLNERIQDQSDSLKSLAHSIDQVAGSQRLAIDTLLDKAGTENPAYFVDRYERAAKARDDARRQLAVQQSINETLGVRTKDLEADNKRLSQYEIDAKQAPGLRQRITDLEKTQEKLQRELKEKTEIAEAAGGQNGAELVHKLNLFRYVSYFLGTLSAALAATVGYFTMRIFGEADSDSAIAEQEPHQIKD